VAACNSPHLCLDMLCYPYRSNIEACLSPDRLQPDNSNAPGYRSNRRRAFQAFSLPSFGSQMLLDSGSFLDCHCLKVTQRKLIVAHEFKVKVDDEAIWE